MHVTILSLILSVLWSECKNYMDFDGIFWGSLWTLSFGSNVSG